MPKLCGLGFSSYIAFFVVLQVIGALEIQAPSSAVLGGTVFISWTSDSSDPLTLNIILDCGVENTYDLVISILTSTKNVTAIMPSPINSQNESFPLSCDLQVRKTGAIALLDQVPIEVDNPTAITLQTSISSASPQTNSASSSALTSSSGVSSGSIQTSVSPPTTSSTVTSPSEQSSPASSTQTSTLPTGVVISGVVGGLIGLGILVIFVIFCLRRRCRPSFTLPPIPLPYDQNYVQPLDKNDYLARIADEREAIHRQRDQLQTEVERISSRQSAQSGTSETSSESGLLEHKIEALSRRILELEAQQHELARQLHDGQSPPSYSNLSSAL